MDETQRGHGMDQWKGKTAFITGASNGIGAAVAIRLLAEGMRVVGSSRRQERVAELLKRELSTLFQRESSTWFGGLFITVTQVRIGPDLGLAKVYLSFMATPNKEKSLKEVEAEGWRVRKALAARVGKQLRRVPELNFYLDDSLDFVDDVQRALDS